RSREAIPVALADNGPDDGPDHRTPAARVTHGAGRSIRAGIGVQARGGRRTGETRDVGAAVGIGIRRPIGLACAAGSGAIPSSVSASIATAVSASIATTRSAFSRLREGFAAVATHSTNYELTWASGRETRLRKETGF